MSSSSVQPQSGSKYASEETLPVAIGTLQFGAGNIMVRDENDYYRRVWRVMNDAFGCLLTFMGSMGQGVLQQVLDELYIDQGISTSVYHPKVGCYLMLTFGKDQAQCKADYEKILSTLEEKKRFPLPDIRSFKLKGNLNDRLDKQRAFIDQVVTAASKSGAFSAVFSPSIKFRCGVLEQLPEDIACTDQILFLFHELAPTLHATRSDTQISREVHSVATELPQWARYNRDQRSKANKGLLRLLFGCTSGGGSDRQKLPMGPDGTCILPDQYRDSGNSSSTRGRFAPNESLQINQQFTAIERLQMEEVEPPPINDRQSSSSSSAAAAAAGGGSFSFFSNASEHYEPSSPGYATCFEAGDTDTDDVNAVNHQPLFRHQRRRYPAH